MLHATKWFISLHDFRIGCDPPSIKRYKKVYFMIIFNNNMNQDHYLTCRLPPHVKVKTIGHCRDKNQKLFKQCVFEEENEMQGKYWTS